MKKLLFVLVLAAGCMTYVSCKKTVESAIDCTGQGLLMSIHYHVDGSSSKLVHFEAGYAGSYTVESVSWDFGDSKTATGKNLTLDHTYTASGTYTVKVKIKIVKDKSSCEIEQTKSVVIN